MASTMLSPRGNSFQQHTFLDNHLSSTWSSRYSSSSSSSSSLSSSSDASSIYRQHQHNFGNMSNNRKDSEEPSPASRSKSIVKKIFGRSGSKRSTGSGSSSSRGTQEYSSSNPWASVFQGSQPASKLASAPPEYSATISDYQTAPGSGASYPIQNDRWKTGAHPVFSAQQISTTEDRYAFLRYLDTVFLIDDSLSMTGAYWEETKAVLRAIVPVCVAHDEDGVDVYFLNNKSGKSGKGPKGANGYHNIRSAEEVEHIFNSVRPQGDTPTGTRLYNIVNPYLRHYEKEVARTDDLTCVKGLNIIVITDGAAQDDPETTIVQAAQKLDRLDAPPTQLGIQFFQVGHERAAAESLRKLDDELSSKVKGGIRDIVDTATFDDPRNPGALTADGILKTVLGGVLKKLDKAPTRPGRS